MQAFFEFGLSEGVLKGRVTHTVTMHPKEIFHLGGGLKILWCPSMGKRSLIDYKNEYEGGGKFRKAWGAWP